MKSLYLTRIYPSHTIFTQAALVALMTFSMSDNIDNIIDNKVIHTTKQDQYRVTTSGELCRAVHGGGGGEGVGRVGDTGQEGGQGQGVCQVH